MCPPEPPVNPMNAISYEISKFYSGLRQFGKLKPRHRTVAGFQFLVMEVESDPHLRVKNDAITAALTTLLGKGFKFPKDTCFWLVDTDGIQNQAFHFDAKGKSVCWITIGPSTVSGGSGEGISAELTPPYSTETKIVIHELGHNLHSRSTGGMYGTFFTQSWGLAPGCAMQVSRYACKSKKEFVAEVFLGRVIGRIYGQDVMQQYAAASGPPVP